MRCPVAFNLEKCSSEGHGMNCDTCIHTQDPLDRLKQSFEDMKSIRKGELPKKSWDYLKEELNKE